MFIFHHFSKIQLWVRVGVLFAIFSLCSAAAVQADANSFTTPAIVASSQETGLLLQTTPPPSTGAGPESTEFSPSVDGENCALLDDPNVRSMMSGVLETALLHACGRDTQLKPVEPDLMLPYSPAALGDDVLVNNPTGDVTALAQSGVVLAYNKTSGVLCAAYDDAYHGFVQNTGYTGFSSSTNRGATWVDHGSLNNAQSYGYPSLTWRQVNGHFYLTTLYSNGLGLWDLGASCDTASWIGMVHVGLNDDREKITVDNNPASAYYGRLYVSWMDAGTGRIYASYSTDGGLVWASPMDVSGHNQTNGSWPAVDPVTGDIYLAWTHWDSYPAGPIDIEMARSTNGGVTWTPIANPMSDKVNPRDATSTSNCSRPALKGDIRYMAVPQIAVDGNRVVHVVYSYDPDGYNVGDVVNVYYRRSIDQGATWEYERKVNHATSNTDQFSPALAVGETGEIGISWYDRQLDVANNQNYDRYMAISRNGGMSFGLEQRISDVSSPVVHDPHLATCYHGDYDGTTAGGGYFYNAWGDDRRGDSDVWSDTEPYTWIDLYGTVYDANTHRGIENSLLVTTHSLSGMLYSGGSDVTGRYQIHVPDARPYVVAAKAYGYIPNTLTVNVAAGGTQADIALTPTARWNVSGRITDANSNYPILAHIIVNGNPFNPPTPENEAWSDGLNGNYLFSNLAASNSYTLTVVAEGYISQNYSLGALTANLANVNIQLQPDLAACTAPGYVMTPPCQLASGAVLTPPKIKAKGCPCETQSHTLIFANHVGSNGEVLLSYKTSPGISVEMPSTLGIVPNTAVKPFDVEIKIDRGVIYSTTVYVTVTASMASNPALFDTSVIAQTSLDPADWEDRSNSPTESMDGAVIEYGGKLYNVGGYGSNGAVDIYDPATDTWTTGAAEPSPIIDFPGDACFGYVTSSDPVILLLPSTLGGGSGVWHRYHIATNTWDTPALPAALPANGIWAPDIVVDYRANQCYITGGAATSGNGNLATLYRYNPADNTASLLGSFTHIPTGFDFHAGWYVPWIGTAGGICVGGGIGAGGTTYAETQCYNIGSAIFNPTNADLGPLPEPWWGMADMEKVAAGGRQLWLTNGINASSQMLQRSAYFNREIGRFVYGPNPLRAVFRVEGAAVGDQVYMIDGSAGGFAPSTYNEHLLQCTACDCGVEIEKSASPVQVTPGGVVTYSVVITTSNWLSGTVKLVDKLPVGIEYTGYINASYGTAWYSSPDNAIYWTRPLGAYSAAGAGTVLEEFTNVWATNSVGLAYNPETDYFRYVHEGTGPRFIHDIAYPGSHAVLHSFNLSEMNPGWPTNQNWRSGVGYDAGTGHYFLTDYGGGGTRFDNLIEVDAAGRVINGWETNGASNDSYDGASITSILDVAVVPGNPPRYFATAFGDSNRVYELNLLKAGQFVDDTWGKVYTYTVAGIGDTAGIEYDDQNGVLYISSWSNESVAVTDLRGTVLQTFTCPSGNIGQNSGISFAEGKWPPEVWVVDNGTSHTSRCRAVGRELLPTAVTIHYSVRTTAPVSTQVVNKALLTCDAPNCADPSALSVLLIRTSNISGSVQRALDELGYHYDTLYAQSDWTGIDFSSYGVVVIGMDGGTISSASIQKIRTDVVDQGKRVILLGGAFHLNFVTGVNQYLVGNNTSNYSWVQTSLPHFTLNDAANPLSQGLPASFNFINANARYYQLRVTDPAIEIMARNGDGYPSYFHKNFSGGGDLVWFIHSVNGSYWGDARDYALLKRIIANALALPSKMVASAAFEMVPPTAITWTKEVYVNGIYAGDYNDGPFTAASGDDVQIVDRLDYTGTQPRFVHLTESWGGTPITQVAEFHSNGAVVNGNWYVTLLPGSSERLVKTVHINDSGSATLTERVMPDGLPAQEQTVVLEPLQFIKSGPASVVPAQLVTYTLTINAHQPLFGSLHLTDTLPAGVQYVGNLSFSSGNAWYNAGANTVYWNNTTTPVLTEDLPQSEVQPLTAMDPETNEALIAPSTGPLSVQNLLPSEVSPESLLPLDVSAAWFSAAPLPKGVVRYAHAQCPNEPNRFYIISGVVSGGPTKNVWRYDAEANTWLSLAPLPSPVEGASAVCYKSRIYVAGGSGTNQFYIYDILTDTWTAGPHLPRGVWGAAMGAWNGRLFLAGGDNDFMAGGQSNIVNVYDIATETWIANGASMPVATNVPGWTQVNEYLYVVGGWGTLITDSITATQRYNMATNTWSLGPIFTSARADFTLAATGQYLYAIGGDANGGGFFDATTLVERLDYIQWASAAWTDIADPLPAALTAYSGGFCTAANSVGEVWSVGGISAGFVYTDTNRYRPSEACAEHLPASTVTITFVVKVTGVTGQSITNTATLDFRGTSLVAKNTFILPGNKIYLPLILRQ
jgi:hypothetical protein